MRHQRLKSVVVEGFTSIRSAALTLNDVNVLVGANGAGKSNFIRALSLLGRIVDGELSLFVGLSGWQQADLAAIDAFATAAVRMYQRFEELDPAPWRKAMTTAATIWADHRTHLPGSQNQGHNTNEKEFAPVGQARQSAVNREVSCAGV